MKVNSATAGPAFLRAAILIGVLIPVSGLCEYRITEFRTATLIGTDNPELRSALTENGFLISHGKTISDGLSLIPHNGVNLIYYRGTPDTLGKDKLIEVFDHPHVARINLVVLDVTDGDKAKRRQIQEACKSLGRANAGRHLALVSQSETEEDSLTAILAEWLGKPGADLKGVAQSRAHLKDSMSGTGRKTEVKLRGLAAVSISPPDKIIQGQSAGDQWLAANGEAFVWCPPGKYTMGDARFENAQPIPVKIEAGFWISKYEFLSAGRKNPLEPVSFSSVDEVIELLSKRASPEGWTWDLPTEAEWEYAARAGADSGLPIAEEDMCCYANFADKALFNARKDLRFLPADQDLHDGHSDGFAPVAYYGPNAWGLHDVLGNAGEFCAGFYTEKPSAAVDYRVSNPQARRLPVTRGGSWTTPRKNMHPAFREVPGEVEGVSMRLTGARIVLRRGERLARTFREVWESASP